MTLTEKYEKCLQDSENFITGEMVNVTSSYKNGCFLGGFFNRDMDYADINIHYGYPMEKFSKDDWDLKIRFQLRKAEINRFSPLDAPYVFKYLATMADSEWSKGEPLDSEAKEIMRGMKSVMKPIQPDLNIKSVGVEWAVHVPDCTTFNISFFYAYPSEEEQEAAMADE